MANVIDTSVILTILSGEPGSAPALSLSAGGVMSAVNLAEVITKCFEFGLPEDAAMDTINALGIEIVEFGQDQAILAGQLRAAAPKGVLSLGDRACLALAVLRQTKAVTGDRIWASLNIGCRIELIR